MRKTVALIFSLASTSLLAQVAPVEDLGGYKPSQRQVVNAPPPAAPNQAVVDLHYEVQSLRDEVRQLRGIVEEQANELRQLRQRQMDDYQDLDRRLSAQPEQPVAGYGTQQKAAQQIPAYGTPQQTVQQPPQQSQQNKAPDYAGASSTVSPGFSPASDPADDQAEQQAYTNTYNLLKARKIDEAVAGFTTLVAKYPNGKYTANAYYWLGEIYLLQNNLPEAEKAFSQVTSNFPAHRKAADATFKLGKVYHQQGKTDQARALLEKVASGNSTAASLAQAYLNDNF